MASREVAARKRAVAAEAAAQEEVVRVSMEAAQREAVWKKWVEDSSR